MQIPLHAKRYAFTQVVKLSPIAASKLLYWNKFKTRLNLENPKTFNEKLMWLKLFEDVEFKRRFTDKVKAREYMITVGYNYLLPPLIGIFDEIDGGASTNNFYVLLHSPALLLSSKSQFFALQTTPS